MKPKSILIGGAMIVCAGLAVFALTRWHGASGGDDEDGSDEKVDAVITVQTNSLQRMTLHRYINGYGTIEPAPATAGQPAAGGPLSSASAGVVAKVNVVAGQTVKEGDVLVELNSATASYNYAMAEVERQKKLFAEQNTSLKNLQDAEAQLASLQIVAPISGTVTRVSARAGAAVDANTVVTEVIDLKRLAVSVQIPASDAHKLKPGEDLQIGESVIAPLSFISPTVDIADGTVLTRALLPSGSGLRPGEIVPVKIITDTRTNCLVAPAESVVTDEDGKSFIAIVKGEEAARVFVNIGLRENGWVEIEGEDLKEGATVVTVGAYGFPDKAKIRMANVSGDETVATKFSPGEMKPAMTSSLGRFATRHALSIMFVAAVLCLAGIFSAWHLPSSVFPQTDFPRVVILVNNGIMPADEMMATVTRPIEEVLKEIPGAVSVRSKTKRGSAEINVFFNWQVDMQRSELYVLGRLSEIRADLPASASTEVERVTFSAFPIIGISLTSSNRNIMDLWETGNYTLKPRFLQIPGVARVELTGGNMPEFHVIVDPMKLQAAQLDLASVSGALTKNNLIAAAGMLQENYHLYLTTVDGRVRSEEEIGNVVIAVHGNHPVLVKDVARVERGPAPAYTVVTAQGRKAVLLNVQSQPDASTLDIARALKAELEQLRQELPPDMKLGFFYDQSQFVRDSVSSVWDAILFGLILSIVILFFFLKNWGSVVTAIVTIPISVLITFVAMKLSGMSFNMMTLGGIAASIGLIIDDAIVVVEAMFVKIAAGRPKIEGIQEAVGEILHPIIGSTLTPVVVFLPLTFLTGITGVFFRALALTMVVSLLTSLVLALTLTPSLAGWFIRAREKLEHGHAPKDAEGGFILRRVLKIYERALRIAIRYCGLTLLGCALIFVVGIFVYRQLPTDFLPSFDERGFVIDYWAPPGTSLDETSRVLNEAEEILRANPNVEGYSRRLGTELGMFITEAYRGDFAVKLKPHGEHTTDEVIAELRHKFSERFPMIRWEFPGILTDVVGDLQNQPDPIEIKLFSPDQAWLIKTAPRVEEQIKKIPGVVDSFNGLTETGPSINFRVRNAEAQRFGLTAQDISDAASAALTGTVSSYALQGDRVVNIRVMMDTNSVNRLEKLRQLPLRTPAGITVSLDQVCDVSIQPSEVELVRDNLRQVMMVTARLEGRDLGSAMHEIQDTLAKDNWLPPGSVEYGGSYQQQQESFKNLLAVLVMAILLVFTVLLIEFRSFNEPIAIVFGAMLAMFGTVAALWITGTTLNIVSFLGAIIGVGIVAKNGILMLDFVQHTEAEGVDLAEALVRSGHRRLRPVLMTSLAATLGMLPLAFGIGAGADMLRPLAVAVIGALCISVLLSLIATPVAYFVLRSFQKRKVS